MFGVSRCEHSSHVTMNAHRARGMEPLDVKELPGDQREQWVQDVVDFSSQYGSETSISYAVPNLEGPSNIYPKYGDFTQASVLRTYGPWWEQSPFKQSAMKIRRTPDSFHSQDFIDIFYQHKVFPTGIKIYETYNPGAVVRILASDLDEEPNINIQIQGSENRWTELWAREASPVEGDTSRIMVPALAECPFPTRLIRLELDSTYLNYYTELDAVLLLGSLYRTSSPGTSDNNGSSVDPPDVSEDEIEANDQSKRQTSAEKVAQELAQLHLQDGLSAALDASDNADFDKIPEEVIQLIISYLDLPSMCRLAQCSHLFKKHCYDPLQHTHLNLQPYWHKVTDSALEGFQQRCRHLQRLSIAWCGPYGNVTPQGCLRFLFTCGASLTCLRLSCCQYVNDDVMSVLTTTCANIQDLDLQSCKNIHSKGFVHLARLRHLRRLNLYRTLIDIHSLISLIRVIPDLEHLNLGSCTAVTGFDDVAIELGRTCTKLKSLDLWRARSLSEMGLRALMDNCLSLEDLDLGWCLGLRSGSRCIVDLVQRCRHIKKLFLTANRTVCDADLMAIATHAHWIEQLDILGTREVSPMAILSVLERCPRLVFFDLSFCSGVDVTTLEEWRLMFPHVSLKRSFQD